MSERSGPLSLLRASAVYAINATYYDCTNTITVGTRANSLRLFVSSATASPGSVTFQIKIANAGSTILGATTYYDYCTAGTAPEIFGPLVFTGADQTKMITLSGLDLLPNDQVKVSFACSTGATSAKIAIVGETYHSDSSSALLSIEDIEIDVAALEVLLTDVPNVIGTDGAAGPSKAVSVAGTIVGTGVLQEVNVDANGDLQVDVLSLPGSLTGYAEDTAHVSGDIGIMGLTVRTDAAAATGAAGDYVPLLTDANGRLHASLSGVAAATPLQVQVGDATTQATVTASLTALKGDVVGIGGTAYALGSVAMAASAPVTIATDDTMFTALDTAVDAIDTNTDDIPNVIGTDGAAGPSKTLSVAGTKADGTINEVLIGTGTMADALAVTLATDDVVSTATGIHDVAAAAKLGGFRLLGNATTALQTAVSAAGDDAKINTDLSGQIRLASHNIATTSDSVREGDPLSAQYDAISLVSNEAVAADPGASYAPSSAGQAWGGYGPASVGLYILGGIGAAAADRTVTVTVEATNGQTVAAAVVWVPITESVKSLLTGLDSAASFTSTGAVAYSDILTLRREDANFTHYRIKYDWSADPSVTNGIIVAMARGAAI